MLPNSPPLSWLGVGFLCLIYLFISSWKRYQQETSTYVEGKRIAFQEQSQIIILAQCGVVGDLRDALFQRKSSLSEELVFEPAKRVLLGDWRHDDPRVVMA